jgi:hypothetical protein
VDATQAGCAQTLFALRTLRQHGMPNCALRTVFQATVVNKFSYAISAWWGFASAALQTVVVSKPSFDGLLRLDTVIRRLFRLPIYVSKLTINCSITFCAKTIIYFVR